MVVHGGLALGDGLGQADGVDDGGVVELVADDDVVRAQQRCRDGLVGVPATHERQGRLRPDKVGAGGLELTVNSERAADEPNGPGAGAEAIERLFARGHHAGVCRQPEVVVGGQDDDLTTSLHADARGLGAVEVVQSLVHTVPAEAVQFASNPLVEDIGHDAISRITFPASPSLMTWMASAILSSGNRWVITGVGSNCPARRNRCI